MSGKPHRAVISASPTSCRRPFHGSSSSTLPGHNRVGHQFSGSHFFFARLERWGARPVRMGMLPLASRHTNTILLGTTLANCCVSTESKALARGVPQAWSPIR
jgi:hypothetical protein